MIRRFMLLLCCLLLAASAAVADAPMIHYLAAEDEKPALPDEGLLEVHLINVASADCILLRMGDSTMMIDSGIRRTSGRIFDYLDKIGVERLDYAFMSHPHGDHVGGFIDVLAQIPTGTFLTPTRYEGYDKSFYRDLLAVLVEQDLPVTLVMDEHEMTLGGATLTFFQWRAAQAHENDRSMITHIQYGDRSMLLAADVENNGQNGLAEAYGARLRADILKMPHHGLAAYMPAFHEAVQPRLATFSNTKENLIPAATRLLKQNDIDRMLTTHGTVVLVTDGEMWWVWQIPNA